MVIPTISLRRKATAAAPAWLKCVALVAVEMIMVMAIMTAAMHRHLAMIYSEIAAQEPMLNLLNNATARVVHLTGRPGAGVRLVYDAGQKRGVLLIATLGNPGDDFSYRLWMVSYQGSRSAWAFQPGTGPLTVVPIKADFSRYQRVAIFVEHRNSSRSAPILFGSL